MTLLTDLTGQTFGRLTVLRQGGKNRHRQAIWVVKCECGSAEFTVVAGSLKHGQTTSCGCYQRERVGETRGSHLVGQTFGRLTVYARGGLTPQGRYLWVARCECGDPSVTIPGSDLISGHTRSCGCLRNELSSRRARHGIEPSRPDTLYVINIHDPAHNEEYIKIGRTVRTLEKRFGGKQYRSLTITPIWLINSTHKVVEKLEAELKQLRFDGCTGFQAFHPTLQIDGYTETFHTSSLVAICEFIDDYMSPE